MSDLCLTLLGPPEVRHADQVLLFSTRKELTSDVELDLHILHEETVSIDLLRAVIVPPVSRRWSSSVPSVLTFF
jgi:hypothetical protein